MAEKFDEKAFFKKMKKLVLIATIFMIVGLTLQLSAFYLEFTQFAPILDEIAGLPKSQIDTASVGSRISNLKIEAAKFPPKIMTFKLVGIGSILIGIFVLLFVIIQALQAVPPRLGKVICPECGAELTVAMMGEHKHE